MPKSHVPKAKKSTEPDQELLIMLQRLQADFINYKQRAENERLQALQNGKEQAIIALLPVLDNIERAISHEPADIKDHKWVQGVTSIAKQLEGQMEAIGLKKIGECGEEFDPVRHEAAVFEDGDGNREVVDSIIQNGYQFDDNIIRPAIVKVKRI